MTGDFDFITVVEALAIHSILLKRHGGSDGIRDHGALEAALFRPRTGYYADVVETAAALLESMSVNHPFIDGNKRAAFGVTDAFLRINGFKIVESEQRIIKKFDQLFASNEFNFKHLEVWLRGIVKPR